MLFLCSEVPMQDLKLFYLFIFRKSLLIHSYYNKLAYCKKYST